MPKKNQDLHGAAPDECKTALLIIDMINDFDFPGGDKLAEKSLPVAHNIFELKQKVKKAGIPVIYVNDNFGRWQSNFNAQIDHCIHDNTLGKRIAEVLKPEEDDYFVLKAKHSAFYSTALDLLLDYLHTETLILTGITSDMCILFTANDAYMRDFKILIPANCTTASTEKDHNTALEYIERIVHADMQPFEKIDLAKLH